MQPIAITAVVLGVIMVAGVSVTLALTRRAGQRPSPAGASRWHRHGSIPLAGAGLALGVISLESGQTPATHNVLFTVTNALLLGAFLCAVAGATAATRGRQDTNKA